MSPMERVSGGPLTVCTEWEGLRRVAYIYLCTTNIMCMYMDMYCKHIRIYALIPATLLYDPDQYIHLLYTYVHTYCIHMYTHTVHVYMCRYSSVHTHLHTYIGIYSRVYGSYIIASHIQGCIVYTHMYTITKHSFVCTQTYCTHVQITYICAHVDNIPFSI